MEKQDLEFLADPVRFARTYCIQPGDFRNSNPDLAVRKQQMDSHRIFDGAKHSMGGGLDAVLNVRDGGRIAFTKLVKDNRPNIVGTYLLDFQPEKWGGADTKFPVWFLPWSSNNVTRMTIPSPEMLKLRARARGKAVSLDPDIFFTAAINGCSVFVTGPRDSPTIWHGGTEEARSNPKSNISVPHFQGLNAAKHWRDIVERVSGAGGYGGGISEVNKGDYTNLLDTMQTSESMEYMDFLKNNQAKTMRIDTIVPMGSVFGWRKDGQWSFYLQKTVEFTITKLTKKRSWRGTKYVDPRGEKGKQAWERTATDQMPVPTASTQVIRLPVSVMQFYPPVPGSIESVRIDPAMVKSILEQY